MTSISFHGAAGTVTGSCYTLTHANRSVFIDCGYFQGPEDIEKLNAQPLGFDPSGIEAGILTHAHLDHCGRLPLLAKGGFTGPIYMTAPTKDMIEIVLTDAVKIMEHDAEDDSEIIYTQEDADRMLDSARVVEYHEPFTAAGIKATLADAGHILGSSFITFQPPGSPHKITFSGDLGNSPQELVMPTEHVYDSHTVVMESTYGDREHVKDDPTAILEEEISAIEQSGGTLMIPSFSIQRTQELLHRLHHLYHTKRISEAIPVFLDSPMAIRMTKLYEHYYRFMNTELKSHALEYPPYELGSLKLTPRSKDSKRIAKHVGPKVIIAGAGMMNGGRILQHAKTYLSDPNSRILFVGYQGIDTPGRAILEADFDWIALDNQPTRVRANITQLHGMSSHAGQSQLIDWLSRITNAKQVFLTHGEDVSRIALKEKLHKENHKLDVTNPLLHSSHTILSS